MNRRSIPINQPRVVVPAKECCECIHFKTIDGWDGFCKLHNRNVGAYDECSAFTLKLQPAEKGKQE